MSIDSDLGSRQRLGSIMAAAAETRAAGPPEHTVLLPKISTDPLDDLVERMRPKLGQAVDSLHVAAALEADGLTDRGARVEFGYADVFALATEVYRRLGPILPPVREAAAPDGRAWRDGLRLIAHGPLYVLPSAVFPAVLAIVGQRSLVFGLVLASTLGWVHAGVTAHAAYRMLGLGHPRSASRVLVVGTLSAPVAGALAGLVLVRLSGGGLALLAMITCQVAYQLTSTVLVFYRRELWLGLLMTPAFLTGTAYLIAGAPLRTWSVAIAAGGVLLAFGIAVLTAVLRGRDGPAEPPVRAGLRAELPVLAGVAAYGLCSAVLLLHAEAPYLLGRLDIAVAAAPLIVSMGFVEWRAERFRPQAVALVRRVGRPAAFVRGVRLLLARETAVCVLVPAVPAGLLLAGLAHWGLLSAAGVVMTAAHVALAGAYLMAYLLAGHGRFGWLCWSMVAAVTAHLGAGLLFGSAPLLGVAGPPLVDTTLYLVSVLLLQVLFALGLVPIIGQARHYR